MPGGIYIVNLFITHHELTGQLFMSFSQNKSIVSPELVGRDSQLQTLNELISQVRDGNGQIVMLAGEAGVGKSRLLAEIKTHAQFLKFIALEGTCFESNRTLPFAPFINLLHSHHPINRAQETSQAPVSTKSKHAASLPGMTVQLLELLQDFSNQPEPEKQRIFESLVQFFFRLAEEAPLLIIIEDLHWSDNLSLDCLLHFIHRISKQRIMLLLSYRSEEFQTGLHHFLAMLKHDRPAIEILLNSLSITEVDEMICEIFELGQPIHAEFLNKIFRLTGGNPYLIEEVLKALIEGGDVYLEDGIWKRKPVLEFHIPLSVQDTVHQRLEQLDNVARWMLTLAAVIGQQFDFALLQDLTQLNDQELILQLKRLIDARLVVEITAGLFLFRHALIREAVYDTLLLLERQKYHHQIAQTLESKFSPAIEPYLADLSYHFFQGALWEKALEYSQRAGDQAQAAFAPLEAVEYYTRALKSTEALKLPPSEALYFKRGQAYEILGDYENTLADYEQALLIAHKSQDKVAEWRNLTALGVLWSIRDSKQAKEFHQLADTLAKELDLPEYYGNSLNNFGNWLSNHGRVGEAIRAHQQALEIFQSQGDPYGIAKTLVLYAQANSFSGDQIESLEQSRQAKKLFRELGDKIGYIASLADCNRSVALTETVFSPQRSLAECKHDATQALEIAHQIRCFAEQAHNELFLGIILANHGEFGEGWAHIITALQIATKIEHHQWIAAAHFELGRLFLAILNPELAIDHLDAGLLFARKLGSTFWIENITVELALTHLLLGELPHAQSLMEPILPQNQPKLSLTGRRIVWCWGQIALSLGQPVKALQIAEQLIASAPGVDRSRPLPVLSKLKGQALMALGELEESELALKEAQQGAEERGARPLLWQIHADLAELQQLLKHKTRARFEFGETQGIIEALAATLEDQDLRENFSRQAMASLPKIKAVLAPGNNKEQNGGLTHREQEIVSLISEGKSNREIAEALIVSQRTVTTHVSNILSKLGFHSRTQIATWVVERNSNLPNEKK